MCKITFWDSLKKHLLNQRFTKAVEIRKDCKRKLTIILTPLRLLEFFFDDVLVDMIFGYTKLHSHRDKAGIGFEITIEKIRLFLTMLLLSGCHKLQTVKCTGRRPPILSCKQGLIQCLILHSSVFFGIFVTMNNLINKTNSRSSLL